jgi:phage terminase large subunit
LIIGSSRPVRVLCAREFQNSIQESVLELLKEQIGVLGLSALYEVQATRIIGRGKARGTEFIFTGLRHNVSKIKSLHGVDYVWVEEAQTVSKTSWEVLIPTIRKEGSEIWISMNPALDSDEAYLRFVLRKSDDTWCQKINWSDNPWFPKVLEAERLKLQEQDPEAYDNIWEGHTRQTLDGAVFAKEMRKIRLEDRRMVGVNPVRGQPVNVYCDLGKRDLTAMWFVQRASLQTRVVGYYENRGEDWPHYLEHIGAHFHKKGWMVGEIWLPHDGFHERLGAPKTIAAMTVAANYTVRQVPSVSIETGISHARSAMAEAWFDEEATAVGWNRLAQYRFMVKDGQWSKDPLHDDNSNAGDAWRYVAVSLREPKRERPKPAAPARRPLPLRNGWMGR